MRVFTKPFQLWIPATPGYTPEEFDTLTEALTADRLEQSDDWFVSGRIPVDTMDAIMGQEMRGNPNKRADPLGKLEKKYQLWDSLRDDCYCLRQFDHLIDALKAPRMSEDWYVTQVISVPHA